MIQSFQTHHIHAHWHRLKTILGHCTTVFQYHCDAHNCTESTLLHIYVLYLTMPTTIICSVLEWNCTI
jgi:hypothetical protein